MAIGGGVNESILETLNRIIEEDFGNTIMDATTDIDEFSKELVDSSMGVTRDGLGRGWIKIQVFKTGLGGAASWRSVYGNAPTTTGDNQQFVLFGTSAPQTFPDLTESTVPSYVQAQSQLKELYGNFHIPVEIMRADQNPRNIGNQMDAILESAARRAALREILAFWAESQSSNGTTTGAYVTGTVATSNITIKADGTYDGTHSKGGVLLTDGLTRYHLLRMHEGECVDIYEYSGGVWTRLNASNQPVFVANTDHIGQVLTLVAYSGSDITMTSGRPFEIHPRSSTSGTGTATITTSAPSPLASWIKSSGTVFNLDLSLSAYPFFKSLVKALSGSETTLSEQILNRYVNGWMVAKPGMGRIDCLVTTPGVKSKYVNNLDYTGRRERHNTPIVLNEGYSEDWKHSRDGYEMEVKTSKYCPWGTLYGLKMRGGNIQKVTPPSPPGTGKESRFGSYVDFLAKITGPSIFTPTRPSGNFSDFIEAPYKRWVEFMPQYIPGMKLTNLDEDIATS